MKKELYIDFDGVILDTIKVIYKMLDDAGIDNKNFNDTCNFISNMDWELLIRETPEINDSINNIIKIMDCNLFNVSILTHVNTETESIAKIKFLNERINGINVISVPKRESKTAYVNPQGKILIDDYSKNLHEWEALGGRGIKFSLDEEPNCPFVVIDRLDSIIDIYMKELEYQNELENNETKPISNISVLEVVS